MHTSSLQSILKDLIRKRYLFVYFFDVEVIEWVEFSRIIVSILLGIEIYDASVGNDAEFFRPFISFKHALSTFPDEANL
jgi:hypothetical protein